MDATHLTGNATLLPIQIDNLQKKEQEILSITPLLPESNLQKRVLPTRSRRGGPGVGSSEIDLTILDAQRRAGTCMLFSLSSSPVSSNIDSSEENRPLIPPSTIFLLVTDSSLIPKTDDAADNAGAKANTSSFYQSYFDRPEVARAFRDQQSIETPMFTGIPSDAVGGRLRARTGDDVCDHPITLRHFFIAVLNRKTLIQVTAHILRGIVNTNRSKSARDVAKRKS